MKNKIAIKLELDSMVNVRCENFDCDHNLAMVGNGFFCNLKNIEINGDKKCANSVSGARKQGYN